MTRFYYTQKAIPLHTLLYSSLLFHNLWASVNFNDTTRFRSTNYWHHCMPCLSHLNGKYEWYIDYLINHRHSVLVFQLFTTVLLLEAALILSEFPEKKKIIFSSMSSESAIHS